jgi:hypothetical protein
MSGCRTRARGLHGERSDPAEGLCIKAEHDEICHRFDGNSALVATRANELEYWTEVRVARNCKHAGADAVVETEVFFPQPRRGPGPDSLLFLV